MLLLTFLGVFVYVLARGKGTGDRKVRHAQAPQQAFDNYTRETASSDATTGNETEQLAKLFAIRSKGDITDAEFQRTKEKILH